MSAVRSVNYCAAQGHREPVHPCVGRRRTARRPQPDGGRRYAA